MDLSICLFYTISKFPFFFQEKERPLKNGSYLKSFVITKKGLTITEPHEVIRKLFGKSLPENELDSVEGLITHIKNHLPKDKSLKIMNDFKEELKRLNLPIPVEIK